MKIPSYLLLFSILLSCSTKNDVPDEDVLNAYRNSKEIWEYDSEGRLIAISNFKKKNNENHFTNEDGFEFLETYSLQEIKPILSGFEEFNFSNEMLNPVILYATKKEKTSTLTALLEDSIRTKLPFDLEFRWSMNPEQLRIDNQISNDLYYALYAVKKTKFEKEKMTGFDISKATQTRNQSGYTISLEFTQNGTEKLAKMSYNNIHKFVAISFKNQVIMAPMVINTISNGKLEISNLNASLSENKKMVQSINQFVRNGERHLFYSDGKLKEKTFYNMGERISPKRFKEINKN